MENYNICYSIILEKGGYSGYVVDTPTCKIPDLNPFDRSIKQFIKRPKPIICDKRGSLVRTTGNYRLAVDWKVAPAYKASRDNLNCCYKSIHRISQDIHNYNASCDNSTRWVGCESEGSRRMVGGVFC